MSIEGKQITDYSSTFNKNPWLIEYLKTSDFVDMLGAFDLQFNEMEEVGFQLLLNMWLVNAEGAQLDTIGIIVGLSRQGRDDTSYRSLLYTKIDINVSSGQPEKIISAIKILFDTENVEYTPVYPAKFRIWTDGSLLILEEYLLVDYSADEIVDYDGNNITSFIEDFTALSFLLGIIPAGVGFLWADNIVDYEGAFLVDYSGNMVIGTYSIE